MVGSPGSCTTAKGTGSDAGNARISLAGQRQYRHADPRMACTHHASMHIRGGPHSLSEGGIPWHTVPAAGCSTRYLLAEARGPLARVQSALEELKSTDQLAEMGGGRPRCLWTLVGARTPAVKHGVTGSRNARERSIPGDPRPAILCLDNMLTLRTAWYRESETAARPAQRQRSNYICRTL